jgi:HAD superfamily hydrolase (TIGR01509 family)
MAVGRVDAALVDAVTLDAYGTLATLVDPLPRLHELLPGRDRDEIEAAFRAEASFYSAHVARGRDAETLHELREACVAVFNEALGSSLTQAQYVDSITFAALPGVGDALERLRALGLTLAVVANWDFSLHERLTELGLMAYFTTVVHAADKPSPDGIITALGALGVSPARALHIGDDDADAVAAAAAGVHFLPAPLPEAVASLA